MIIARYAIGNDIHYGQQISPTQWRRLSGVPFEAVVHTDQIDDNQHMRLLCPVERPRIFGVGFNYAAHAKETGHPLPTRAATFMKPDSAAIGPGEAIVYPAEGQRVDFECELAVIIGKGGRRIAPADVDQHIFGFTCANDVSERPIQFAEMEAGCLLIGKGFDSFCPLGPVIATGLNHRNLAIATRLNGQLRQSSNTWRPWGTASACPSLADIQWLISVVYEQLSKRESSPYLTTNTLYRNGGTACKTTQPMFNQY